MHQIYKQLATAADLGLYKSPMKKYPQTDVSGSKVAVSVLIVF